MFISGGQFSSYKLVCKIEFDSILISVGFAGLSYGRPAKIL